MASSVERGVPIPYRLRKRPTHGSLPIPYLVAVLDKEGQVTTGAEGVPDFRVADPVRVARCMQQRRCGLCGQTLERTMVFIGGPGIRDSRLSCEPPGHEECARYALRACPYLAGKTARRLDDEDAARRGLTRLENTYERADQGGGLFLLYADSYRSWQREETGVWYYDCAPWVKVEEVRA